MAIYGNASRVRISDEPKEVRTGPCMRMIEPHEDIHPDNVRRALLAGADLTEGQMFAMMNASTEHRHQAIWHHARLNIFELPPFTFGTFAELAKRGYVEKPEGSKYHRLATNASALANAVADELVTRHRIHAPLLVHGRGKASKTMDFRCTCNWSCSISTWNLQKNASRAFSSHLRSVNTLANIADSIAASTRRHGAEKG